MDLDNRKLRILAAIVEAYISTGEPVGSKLVAMMLGSEVSSATVRNDMGVLFDMGLLEQPHTSAGRIPSHLGLRVYIDRLLRYKPLSQQEQAEIDSLFNVRSPDPDRLMEEAAQALADQTSCATISTTFPPHNVFVKRIELIPVGDRTVVILLVCSNGVVKNKVCRVNFNVTPRILEFFQNFSNGRLAGVSLSEITAKYINAAALSLGEYSEVLGSLLSAIYELCREANSGQYYRRGTSHLLEHDDLRDMARELFGLLDRRKDVFDLVWGDHGGVEITIGKENTTEELVGSSLIVSRYKIGENNLGAIGLIGPVRMDYANIVPKLEYFTKTLSKLLTETFEE